MSVIIRLQNLPWSANALDIRNFFRGLSIPEGGVHIVGGELGDAFIAFSTDEDARQAMMLDCGKIKEIQVKLLLSSRSEMHKVIEQARQTVPILSLPLPAPAAAPPAPFPAAFPATPGLAAFGIPGLGNPLEIPQPAVIEPPAPLSLSPPIIITPSQDDDERKNDRRDRRRSRSRDKKDRKRDRRDRSRSRDRRRRERSRSRDRKDRRRKDRSRSSERPGERPVERPGERSAERSRERSPPSRRVPPRGGAPLVPAQPPPLIQPEPQRFDVDTLSRLHELGKKRNPNAFQPPNDFDPPSRPLGMEALNGRALGSHSPAHNNNGDRGGDSGRFQQTRNFRFEMERGKDNGGGRDGGGKPESERDCCVAIRNAPNHTSYGDVRRFFPFLIDKHGIKMINDELGRRTGNILVKFCDARSRHLALQRRINVLKEREVVVEGVEDAAYEAAVDSFLPYRRDEPEPRRVLRLDDLPFYIKEHDLMKAFADFSLLSIALTECRATRTKTAHVVFALAEHARLAFERRDALVFGRRAATVSALTDAEWELERGASEPGAAPPVAAPSPSPPRDPRQQRRAEPPGPAAPPAPSIASAHLPPGPMRPDLYPTPPQFASQHGFPPGNNAPPQFAGFQQGPQFSGFPQQGGPLGAGMPPGMQQPGMPPGMQQPGMPPGMQQPGMPPGMQQPGGMPLQFPLHNGGGEAPPAGPIAIDEELLDCVLMKGLPRNASDRTIVEFLSDTGAVPARIHLMLEADGQPSGDCFCEFRSEAEARRAAGKHGRELAGHRVTVDPVPRSVVDDALEGPKPPPPLLPAPPHASLPLQPHAYFEPMRGGPGFAPDGPAPHRGRGRGGFDRSNGGPPPSRGDFEQAGPRFSERGRGRGGMRGRGGFDRDRGNFDRDGGNFDRDRGNFDRDRGNFDRDGGNFDRDRGNFDRDGGNIDRDGGTFDRDGRGFDRGAVGSDRDGARFDRGGYRGGRGFDRGGRGFDRGGRGFDRGGRGRGGFGRGRPQFDEQPIVIEDKDPIEEFGAPGCVVTLENVPFRASTDDILKFFSEYSLTQDDVIRRFNEHGLATGDARVAFRTPFDAQRAVKTHHMETIHDRRITLSIL